MIHTNNEPGHLSPSVYAAQTQLLESLRDIWPQQKGLAVLLFQNDLFHRIRRLESAVESCSAEVHGFLPADFPEWKGATTDYESAWISIESELVAGETDPLDRLEDEICAWCEDMIPDSLAFFEAALENGSLDERWLEIAETLLDAEEPAAARIPVEVTEEEAAAPPPTPEPEMITDHDLIQERQPEVIELQPEPVRSRPTRRRKFGLPLTPSRVRRLVRQTRRHK